MHLSRLYIKNYRSIRELDLEFSKGKNVLVGRNNTGKSNIIRALDLALGENSPTWAKSDNISDNDFYSWKEEINGKEEVRSANEIYIWCELRREAGESLDYDEIYNCYGYYVHSRNVSAPRTPRIYEPVRISRNALPSNPASIFGISEDGSTEKEYINPKLRNQKNFERQLEDKQHFAFAFYACRNENGDIEKDIRFLYRESEQHDWILAFRATIRCELLQSAIIPSFRDPQSQLRPNNWTWYGKLMKYLTADHVNSHDLQDAFAHVRNVADNIFSSVKAAVIQSSLDIAFPGTELFFQFNADSRADLYKNCVIYVDDGFRSALTDKGSGIQSATIIGLFNYYTQFVNTRTSALLCIEEPEIYLHPHARRVISDRLDDFLGGGKNQVVLSTHSTEFIRTTSTDLTVILIAKEHGGTIAQPVQIGSFKDLLLDNNQNELFFADKVIVCEGHDAHILRAVAKQYFPKKLDEGNISIVQVGGKDNLSRLAHLVIRLGIKCFVFADFDYLLRDKTGVGKNYGADQHESILNCGPHFFSQECMFGHDGNKVYGQVEKARTALREESERNFYLAKRAIEFSNPDLPALLSKLRSRGIGILSGEIENAVKDTQILSRNGKLDLESVFKLSARLNAGEKIDEILDADEIVEFLGFVVSA